ncbi:MAG: hypothetical protein GY730_08645 [bacterium]|nr:hypothetical protein [bacterium]
MIRIFFLKYRINIKILSFLMFCLFFLSWGSSDIYSTVSGVRYKIAKDLRSSSSYNGETPRSSKAPYLFFSVKADDSDQTITAVNVSTNDKPIDSISTLYLYRDDGTYNGTFEEDEDQLLSSISWQNDSQFDLTSSGFSELLVSGNETGYFIVADVLDDAVLEDFVSITLNYVSYEDNSIPQSDLTYDLKSTIKITGLNYINGEDVSKKGLGTGTAIPGQENIPVLRLLMNISGEDLDPAVTLNIYNSAENFVISSNFENGIVKATLYKAEYYTMETYNPELFGSDRYIKIDEVEAGSFDSASELSFVIDSNVIDDTVLPEASTQNYFILYDIGEDFPVSTDSKVYAQLKSIEGTGSGSGLEIKSTGLWPDTPASVNIGGLTYDNAYSIVPNTDTFGSGTVAPMMMFSLEAHQIPVSINAIIIDNTWTRATTAAVPFVNGTSDENGIKRVVIYEDTNNDEEFDGIHENSSDTLIGSLDLQSADGISEDGDEILPVAGRRGSKAVVTMNQALLITEESSKTFFVIYYFGIDIKDRQDSSGNVNTHAAVELSQVIGTSVLEEGDAGIKSVTINLSGTLPVPLSPEAKIDLESTNLYIMDIQDISPSTVIEGQTRAPMLYVKLFAVENTIASASVILGNPQGTFSLSNTGVSKIWIYRDSDPVNTAKPELDSVQDSLLAVNDYLSNSSQASVYGVEFVQGENYLFICYDIGQVADGRQIGCQINDITGSLTFGGETPVPKEAAASVVSDKYINISKVGSDIDSSQDLPSSFQITVSLQNTHSSEVGIDTVLPRFYKGGIGGTDVSSEFSIELADQSDMPVTINPGASLDIYFDVSHSYPISDGIVYIDGYTFYRVPSGSAYLSRWKVVNLEDVRWNSASDEYITIAVQSTLKRYDWTLPPYIESLTFGASVETEQIFVNYNAIPEGSTLLIYLNDQGNIIDEASIQISLNGSQLSRVSNDKNSDEGTFFYDRTLAKIRVPNVGEENGTLLLQANDLDGTPLDEAAISFYISDQVKIKNLLFYPSPYYFGDQNLSLCFNITQPSEVDIYIFNHLGSLVWSHQESCDLGYNEIEIDSNNDFLRSGMYICKMKATDNDGNSDMAVTKLAIY